MVKNMKSNTMVMRKNTPLTVSALRRFISSTGKNHSQTFQKQFNVLDQEVRKMLYPSKIIEDAGVLFQCLKPDYSSASWYHQVSGRTHSNCWGKMCSFLIPGKWLTREESACDTFLQGRTYKVLQANDSNLLGIDILPAWNCPEGS